MPFKNCPPPKQLDDYLLGNVDAQSAELLDTHIATCDSCRTALVASGVQSDALVALLQRELGEGEFDHEPELRRALDGASEFGSGTNADNRCVSLTDTAIGQPTEFNATRLGQYRLLTLLGQGGMGAVYKAQHERLEMIVAVKVLSDRLTSDRQAVARFDREMKAVGKVSHPNIVRATDAGEDRGHHYLAMEFVDGLDLSQVIRARGPWSINDACEAIRQAAHGIQHAHDHGLIHRDIKPSNLMVTKDGQVKVLDLGLARLHKQDANEGLTSDLQVMGTADYMAPEQALKAAEVDSRADIYSLGCTLYALLCGRPPFSDANHGSSLRKLMAHEQEQPTAVIDRRADVPLELSMIIDRALAKSPEDRFATASEFADALRPFSADADLASLCAVAPDRKSLPGNTSDVSRHLAMTDTVTSLQERKPERSRTTTQRSRSRLVATAMVLLVLLAGAAGLVLHFNTSAGTIVVEMEGSQITAELEGQHLLIVDKVNGQSYRLSLISEATQRRLPPGSYAIRVENQSSGLQLDAYEFQLSRRDRVVIKAYVKQGEASAERQIARSLSSQERSIAEWAIDKGAVLDIVVNDRFELVGEVDRLPADEFRVAGIDFTKPFTLTDEDFERLINAPSLNHLYFQDLDLSDRVVSHLAAVPQLAILNLRYDESQPRGLEQLRRLPQLFDLTVGGTFVGDEELIAIRTLENVRRLTASGRQVTDAGLVHLGAMNQLEFISLIFTQVDGSGLVHLQQLPKLWGLHLPYTPTNDAGLESIAGLSELTWLNLGFTQVSDQYLVEVSKLKKLETLELNETRITSVGLAELRDVPTLRLLDLQGTDITDADFEQLAAMTQLTRLRVGSLLSADTVAALRRRLPNCTID